MTYIKMTGQFFLESVICAVLYIMFFYFNDYAMTHLEAAQGVSWIFLPAGLRIFLTLIFNYSAAFGLAIASLVINWLGFYEADWVTIFGIALICAIAPLLGRHFVIHNVQVNADLSNISIRNLLITIVIFSLLSSGLHQLWFVTRGIDSGSFNHFIAMFVGDVLGSILFVAIIKYGIDLLKGRLGRKNLIE